MTEDTESGRPEGEALPASIPAPASLEQRVTAAIDAWYVDHFHAAAVAGRAPLSADDKDALVKSVTAAVAPATKE